MRGDDDGLEAARAADGSRFSGTLMDMLDRVTYARVRLDVVDHPIFRLRYEAYTREGFMPANADHICTDALDKAPNAMGFGVYIDGQLVSSIRCHHLTKATPVSPSMSIYSDILGPMLDQGLTLIDPTRLAADHDASLAFPALPFLTVRLAVMASVHFGVDYCLASVRPEHTPFYRRVFGASELGPIRYYPGLDFPCSMYAMRMAEVRKTVAQRYPFVLSTAAEREALFAPSVPQGYNLRIRPSAKLALEEAMARLSALSIAAE